LYNDFAGTYGKCRGRGCQGSAQRKGSGKPVGGLRMALETCIRAGAGCWVVLGRELAMGSP
jgi:hypothetical protein